MDESIDAFRECPQCDKPVMGPTALLAHLEFSHGVEDPIGYLLELQAPDRPRRWSLRRRSKSFATPSEEDLAEELTVQPEPEPEPVARPEPEPVAPAEREPEPEPEPEPVLEPEREPEPVLEVEPRNEPEAAPVADPEPMPAPVSESARSSAEEFERLLAEVAEKSAPSAEPTQSAVATATRPWPDPELDVAPSPRDAWVEDLPERRAHKSEQSFWRRNRLHVSVGVAAGVIVVGLVVGSLLGGGDDGGAVTALDGDDTAVEGFRKPFARDAGVEECTAGGETNAYEIGVRRCPQHRARR